MMQSLDFTFQALAHPIRRQILDYVTAHPGCTNGAIAEQFSLSRIAISKHIKILHQAELLILEKAGRQHLHYFNVMPIQTIYERWTDEYSRFFASKLNMFKQQIENNNNREEDHEQTA